MDSVEKELWRRYTHLSDTEARDYLFLRYCPWARMVARSVVLRTSLRMMEWADHVQNAQIGMLEAMMRYDVEYGIEFIQYAKPRVRGAVFNGMRIFLRADAMDSKHRVPVERLESLRDDEDDELIAFVDSVVGLGLGLMLDGQCEDMNADQYDSGSWSSLLQESLLDISVRRREILIAHYIHQKQFQDIAREMGVTKGRVSQLHKEGLVALRECMRKRRFERDCFF
ncbi:sigma-70 family RNA polymerase sigma factor [Stenotrophomonas sp. MYb238]|uniref:sigma-70 family RNA polymerase sigma factor n=1 Tax=Stenotrophomonas sp. MYb238 TaxID=2040281 RepID=UPI0012918B83|nr:sigma-70 family RNA polymerase sigma factor [Stenotrophomonas sp. MYb238]MQP74740.1 sigma-70 family RNA polymerase sigma factor [Stenotrophomonas sp. MYb238]